jgi:hypothetical protein
MSDSIFFRSVSPIGDTKTEALPVESIDTAVRYYKDVLGFTPVTQQETSATLKRDDVTIGLAVSGEDPEQASCYFSVSDVESLRQVLASKGMETSELRTDVHEGNSYRVFFAKEPYGVCFCFGQPVSDTE